jgi:hypothetical protein
MLQLQMRKVKTPSSLRAAVPCCWLNPNIYAHAHSVFSATNGVSVTVCTMGMMVDSAFFFLTPLLWVTLSYPAYPFTNYLGDVGDLCQTYPRSPAKSNGERAYGNE